MKPHLGLAIPTNRPEEFFGVLYPSLSHLTPMLKTVGVHLLLTFQPPWTADQIKRVEARCEELTLGCRWTMYRPRKGSVVSMNHLRNAATALLPEAAWWMFADDNFIFKPEGTPRYPGGSAVRYLHVLDYFTTFPQCGVVMCEGSLGGTAWKYSIRPTKNGLVATSRGLFYRNIGADSLYIPDEVAIKGGLCETSPAYRLMSRGYYVAKQFNNPTHHIHRHKFSHQVPDTHITNYEKVVKPNAERYIRELYRDPDWTHERRYFPIHVWRLYREAGGDMSIFGKTSTHWKNYEHHR